MMEALITLTVVLSIPIVVVFVLIKRRSMFPAAEKQPVFFPLLLPYSLAIILIAFNICGYPLNAGIGAGIFGAVIQAGILLAMDRDQRKPSIILLAVCGMIISILLGIRGNDFLLALNRISAATVIILLLLAQSVHTVHWRGQWLLTMLGRYASGILDHIPHLLSLSRNRKNSQGGMLISALKTVVLTFVALFFFSTLLSQADAVFAHVIDEISKEVVPRFGYSLLIAVLLTIVLTMKFVVPQPDDARVLRFLKFHEMLIPTASIAILFAVFLFIQAKYLFGSHENIRLYDITYSDYVRKGFMELLVASFFGGLLSYAVNLRARNIESVAQKRQLKAVNVIVIAELCLMLASALKRDYLYMDTYGITRVRIIGEVFVWWLAGLFVLLFAFTAFRRMREEHLFAGIGLLSVAAVFCFNAMNMDARIAGANPPHNRQKDLYYISLLSTDASSEWKSMILDARKRYQSIIATDATDGVAKAELASVKLAMRNIAKRIEQLEASSHQPWQAKTASNLTALQRIQADPALYKKLPGCLVRDILLYQVRHQLSVEQEASELEYDANYPFVFNAPRYEHADESLESINSDYIFTVIGANVPRDEKGLTIPPDIKRLPQATGCGDIVVR